MFGLSFPSRSTAISLTALVISLGGAAFSATGGNFILGAINSASNQSGIVSPVNGKMLLLNNTSTAPNATALGLTVAKDHPPLVVNSDTKVEQLNADKLDGLTGADYARVIGFKRTAASGSLTSTTDNYYLAPAFTVLSSGRCLVIASTQVTQPSATGDRGPFYRLAIKRGANSPQTDGQFGHYFPPVWGNGSSLVSPDLTRSFMFDVTAGETIQFGVYLGYPPATWVGSTRTVHAQISYYCTAIGGEAGPSFIRVDASGLQQDRQARAQAR